MNRPLLVLLGALLLPGCVSTELARFRDEVAREIEAQPGVHVREIGTNVSFGGFTMGMARGAVRVSDADDSEGTELAADLLGHVHSVRMAHYAVEGLPDPRALGTPRLVERYERDGWLPVVVLRDTSAAAWVLLREEAGQIADVFAVALTPTDLALARISGTLSEGVLLALAEAEDGGLFDEALATAGLTPEAASAPTGPQAKPPAPLDTP